MATNFGNPGVPFPLSAPQYMNVAATNTARVTDTEKILVAGQWPTAEPSISTRLYMLNGEANPFCVLTESGKMLPKLGCFDVYHRWFEDKMVPQKGLLHGSGQTGNVLTVVDARIFTVQDTIFVRTVSATGATKCAGRITAVNTTLNTITILWDDAPVGALADGTPVIRIGNAYAQDSTANLMPRTLPVEYKNAFQIMRHAVAATDLARTGHYILNPSDPETQALKCNWEHERAKEKTQLFGTQARDVTTASTALMTMDGLYTMITTNRTVLNAPLSRVLFEDFLDPMLRKRQGPGSPNWHFLHSGRIGRQITTFAYQYQQIMKTGDIEFGMHVTRYYPPNGGVVTLVPHPLFDEEGWDDLGILINVSPENLQYCYHSIWDTKRYDVPQTDGRTIQKYEHRTVMSLEAKGEEINYGVLEGVNAV